MQTSLSLTTFSLCFIYLHTQVFGQECNLVNVDELIPIITPSNGRWVSMDTIGVHVNNSTVIVLGMVSCHGVHILLQNDANDREHLVYEIVIGGKNNTRSGMRDCIRCKFSKQTKHEILHCRYFNYIWVSWCESYILVGKGYVPGEEGFIMYERKDRWPIRSISIRTDSETHWAISCKSRLMYSITRLCTKCCSDLVSGSMVCPNRACITSEYHKGVERSKVSRFVTVRELLVARSQFHCVSCNQVRLQFDQRSHFKYSFRKLTIDRRWRKWRKSLRQTETGTAKNESLIAPFLNFTSQYGKPPEETPHKTEEKNVLSRRVVT